MDKMGPIKAENRSKKVKKDPRKRDEKDDEKHPQESRFPLARGRAAAGCEGAAGARAAGGEGPEGRTNYERSTVPSPFKLAGPLPHP